MEALDRRRAAAEKRADRKALEARFLEQEQREEEERVFVLGLRPARRRRRTVCTGGGRSGTRSTRNELAEGPHSPDPVPG